MNSVYGEVDDDTNLLAALYSARQKVTESVADWGCRLETLFDAARCQTTLPGNPDSMLRNMMWSGLRQDLKDVSAYQFATSRTFDDLRVMLRRIEKQHAKPDQICDRKAATCRSAQGKKEKEDKSDVDKLTALVQQLVVSQQQLADRVIKIEQSGLSPNMLPQRQ